MTTKTEAAQPVVLAIADMVTGAFEKTTTWIAIVLFVSAVVYLFRDVFRSYRLLRVVREGRLQSGGRLAAVGTILGIAFQDWTFLAIKERKIFRRVRMRAEHEMFPPTPQIDLARFQSPTSRKLRRIPGDETGAQRVELYQAALAKWKRHLPKIYKGDPTIKVANAAEVNAHFAEMDRYFDVLADMGVDEEGKYFICPIEIESGFITPLHLLTGLLIEFNQKWGNVLSAFNRDASKVTGPLGESGGDIREIQMFIYTCWLLWGPSIPVCGCARSDARFRSVQYGFGDENNSLEIVGAASRIDPLMKHLLDTTRNHIASATEPGKRDVIRMPMALPVTVRGRLRLSDTIGLDRRDTNALPGTALTSWKGGADRRPVLYISTIKQGAEGAASPYESVNVGEISLEEGAVRSKYYSAYLWIAFVMMEEKDGRFTPLSQTRNEARPWTDLVPFFEHGNLADAESLAYGKAQLAAKVAEALVSAVENLPKETTTRLVFACAIDDPGCNTAAESLFAGWQGGERVRDLVRARVRERAGQGDPDYVRLQTSGVVIFEPDGAAWRAAHDYSACALPDHVALHYKTMDDEAVTA
ncbi:hypothetical protein [Brevundimonas goettingensis]|uniref:Uncharacterized protein n=1 Tax=Brevundimonas goettingensis TaxID=2774190 RepID=A0A975BZG6_9CAUL|nr:hypothetical protein [Brevundimonas goettingensis]QTC90903.1 hypothetical protein IFJ75_17005 [Brevundimonas goettingensis]